MTEQPNVTLDPITHPVGTRLLIRRGKTILDRHGAGIDEIGIVEWSPEGRVKIKPGPIWYEVYDMPLLVEVLAATISSQSKEPA